MERRELLASLATAAFAGCVRDDGLADDDVEAVGDWILDGASFVETAHRRLAEWEENPAETDRRDLTWLAAESDDVLVEFDEEIDRIWDDLEDAEVERSSDGETWTVEGDRLTAALTDLERAVRTGHELSTIAVDAGGDPDELEDPDRSLLEAFFEDGVRASERALALWFGGGLENSPSAGSTSPDSLRPRSRRFDTTFRTYRDASGRGSSR